MRKISLGTFVLAATIPPLVARFAGIVAEARGRGFATGELTLAVGVSLAFGLMGGGAFVLVRLGR
jgi:hypothetical protein